MLYAQGFTNAEALSQKIVPLFNLCRDQLFTFAVSPGRFHSKAHIQELLDHARVVVADGPVFTPKGRAAEPCLRTEVAFERTIDGTIIERVNDLFDTRSLMHEKVYQCGCGPAPPPRRGSAWTPDCRSPAHSRAASATVAAAAPRGTGFWCCTADTTWSHIAC